MLEQSASFCNPGLKRTMVRPHSRAAAKTESLPLGPRHLSAGASWWCSGKEPTWQSRRLRRQGFSPWIRKIPWRRKWQPIPGFLPGESHGQRSLAGYIHRVTKSQTQLNMAQKPFVTCIPDDPNV